MKVSKNNLIFLLKIIVIFFVIYYLTINIDKQFIENISNSYFIIIITIPILILRIFINSLKISYLLKILNKKSEDLKHILKIIVAAQLSLVFPGSFLASKAWIDGNLINKFKLNLKEYLKFNLLILLFSLIIIFFFILLKYYFSIIVILSALILIFSSRLKIYRNYFLYFIFYLLNLILNISISFIVIYFLTPELISNNFINIFFSSLISIYLDTFSFLPFNIGYSQMTYGITFQFLSLPKDIAFTIATIIQISQIIIVLFISIFLIKSLRKSKYTN